MACERVVGDVAISRWACRQRPCPASATCQIPYNLARARTDCLLRGGPRSLWNSNFSGNEILLPFNYIIALTLELIMKITRRA